LPPPPPLLPSLSYTSLFRSLALPALLGVQPRPLVLQLNALAVQYAERFAIAFLAPLARFAHHFLLTLTPPARLVRPKQNQGQQDHSHLIANRQNCWDPRLIAAPNQCVLTHLRE